MIDSAKIEEKLVESSLVDDHQLKQARRFSSENDVDLADALTTLNIVRLEDLGRCLSDASELPYAPLLDTPPSEQVRSMMSARFASCWNVFPKSYDPSRHILTVAVHEPEQTERMERLRRLLMQDYALAFTIASRTEVQKAIQKHLVSGHPPQAGPAPPEPKTRDGLSSPAGKAKMSLSGLQKKSGTLSRRIPSLARAGSPDPAVSDDRKERPSPISSPTDTVSPQPLSYETMSRALIGTVSVLAAVKSEQDPQQLEEVRARVRYCQLLASRLNLSTVQTDSVVFSAWASCLADDPERIRHLGSAYGVDEVLYSREATEANERIESWILSLVMRYQELRREQPAAAKDASLTRRHLRAAASFSPERQNLLETFLQVLMDEQFLAKLDRSAGRILIVDPAEVSTALLAPPLNGDGYSVDVSADAESALRSMGNTLPDLILCEIELPGQSGLQFCQAIKRGPETAPIPVIMMAGPNGRKQASECLRAGAEDVVTKPVDLELLFLKIDRLLTSANPAGTKNGVSGNLQDMNFTDMIQILCAGSKSMKIDLSDGDRQAEVYIRDGDIVHATVDDLTGQDAFYTLMKWERGEFTTSTCPEFPEATIHTSAMSLLMEGARQVDEGDPVRAA